MALLGDPACNLPRQCKTPFALGDGKNKGWQQIPGTRLPESRWRPVSQSQDQVFTTQHQAVPAHQFMLQLQRKPFKRCSGFVFVVCVSHNVMLKRQSISSPGVMPQDCFTPGFFIRFDVEQNYKEVFDLGWSMCQEVEKISQHPIADPEAFVREIRIKNLYGCLVQLTGMPNFTAMQRFFEPTSVTEHEDGGLSHSRKYRGYERGISLPGPATMEIINRETGQDLNVELHQILWHVLNTAKMPAESPDELFLYLLNERAQRLSMVIYKAVLRQDPEEVREVGYALLEISGFTSLTALTLLLRIAHQMGNQSAAVVLAQYLAWKLAMMGVELHQRGVASMMFRFFEQHVFSLATQWAIKPTALDMARRSMLINLLPYCSDARMLDDSIDHQRREKIMFLWIHQFHGELLPRALSFKSIGKPAKRKQLVTERLRLLALRQVGAIAASKKGQSDLVYSNRYVSRRTKFRMLGKYRLKEFQALLLQLAGE